MSDAGKFFREFARNPGMIGSVTPSSRHLARLTVESAAIEPGHVIVELGAGTGPMTRELSESYPDNPVLVLEPNPELAVVLRERYPSVTVVEGFAQDLPDLVRAWGHDHVDRVVSSLPWAAWDQELQNACFQGVLEILASDGKLVTFTYVQSPMLAAGKRFRKTLERHFADVGRSRTEMRNVPPAFVYICEAPRQDVV